MSVVAVEQASRVTPPRRGACAQLTVDATARPYSLTSLALGGFTPDEAGTRSTDVYLTLQPNGADVFFVFSSATASDLDETAAVSAGGTLAFANTHGAFVKDGVSVDILINRALDKFLIVKTASGSAVLHIRASSEAR